jgi:ABC-type nitrate/sulfonate/bicarbonate transport system substrate-binding protein
MGKEISLGDLSASVVGTNRPNVPVVNSSSKVKPISTNELGKFLEKEHPEEAAAKAKSKEEMTPELVEDAFASMNKTIQEKKDNADKMVEDLSRALEEKSLESDLDNISNGKESSIEADNTAKNTVRDSGDILDELANFNLDDEDISTEESKEENTNVVVPSSTVEEPTV